MVGSPWSGTEAQRARLRIRHISKNTYTRASYGPCVINATNAQLTASTRIPADVSGRMGRERRILATVQGIDASANAEDRACSPQSYLPSWAIRLVSREILRLAVLRWT